MAVNMTMHYHHYMLTTLVSIRCVISILTYYIYRRQLIIIIDLLRNT